MLSGLVSSIFASKESSDLFGVNRCRSPIFGLSKFSGNATKGLPKFESHRDR